jgi:NAD(P)-dependent dehydrogenase (short-subunit alcohol dehydrogenase family)
MEMKTILVTGASNGIGYHTAMQLAVGYSCRVIALSRNMEKLRQLNAEIKSQKNEAEVHLLNFDLSTGNFQQVTDFFQSNAITVLDGLINNAGWIINKPFSELTYEDWLAVYSVNVFGAASLIRHCLPLLEKSKNAHVVNISSNGGIQGTQKFSGLSAYSSSKGALTILTECLAEEFKLKNISVNCLAPGAVNTGMLQQAFPGFKAEMQPSQMAEYISWFCINGHRFFNGKILPVTTSVV